MERKKLNIPNYKYHNSVLRWTHRLCLKLNLINISLVCKINLQKPLNLIYTISRLLKKLIRKKSTFRISKEKVEISRNKPNLGGKRFILTKF